MAVAIDVPQAKVDPAEALWTIFQSQPKNVQVEFLRILGNEGNIPPRHRQVKYTDLELDAVLNDCPMVHEEDIPEVSDEDYKLMVRNMAHKPNKHVEKWL